MVEGLSGKKGTMGEDGDGWDSDSTAEDMGEDTAMGEGER